MPTTHILALDHLEQAVHVLRGSDAQTRQLRYIVERTLELMREIERRDRVERSNVVHFESWRSSREPD